MVGGGRRAGGRGVTHVASVVGVSHHTRLPTPVSTPPKPQVLSSAPVAPHYIMDTVSSLSALSTHRSLHCREDQLTHQHNSGFRPPTFARSLLTSNRGFLGTEQMWK